jgi:hypothetical protein
MTTITIYARPADSAKLDHLSLVCHGIGYEPAEVVKVNDLYKLTFVVNTEPDLTPVLRVTVSDGIKIAERL